MPHSIASPISSLPAPTANATYASSLHSATNTNDPHVLPYTLTADDVHKVNTTTTFYVPPSPPTSPITPEEIIAALRNADIWRDKEVLHFYYENRFQRATITFKSLSEYDRCLQKTFRLRDRDCVIYMPAKGDLSFRPKSYLLSVMGVHPSIKNATFFHIFKDYGSHLRIRNHVRHGTDANGVPFSVQTDIRQIFITDRNAKLPIPQFILLTDLQGNRRRMRVRHAEETPSPTCTHCGKRGHNVDSCLDRINDEASDGTNVELLFATNMVVDPPSTDPPSPQGDDDRVNNDIAILLANTTACEALEKPDSAYSSLLENDTSRAHLLHGVREVQRRSRRSFLQRYERQTELPFTSLDTLRVAALNHLNFEYNTPLTIENVTQFFDQPNLLVKQLCTIGELSASF